MTAPPCRAIRSEKSCVGRQGFAYLASLTGDSAGSRALCMTVLTLTDGARAKTRLHEGIETAVYIIAGEAEISFGERLENLLHVHADGYVYIPADMPHLVLNPSGAPCRALVAHSAADDQAGIVLLPHLDAAGPDLSRDVTELLLALSAPPACSFRSETLRLQCRQQLLRKRSKHAILRIAERCATPTATRIPGSTHLEAT